jgi:phage FluMu protein Com
MGRFDLEGRGHGAAPLLADRPSGRVDPPGRAQKRTDGDERTMPIRFRCDYCGQLLSIASRKAGSQAQCPKCQHENTVPSSSSEPEGRRRSPSQFFESSRFDEWIGRLSEGTSDEESSSGSARRHPRDGDAPPRPTSRTISQPSAPSLSIDEIDSSSEPTDGPVEPWQPEPERLPPRSSKQPPPLLVPSPTEDSFDESPPPSVWRTVGWAMLAVSFLLVSFGLGVLVGRYGFPHSSG